MVQATLTGRADIHAGALADRFEPLEHLDRRSVVGVVNLAIATWVLWTWVVACHAGLLARRTHEKVASTRGPQPGRQLYSV